MNVKLLRATVVNGAPHAADEVVVVNQRDGAYLLALKKAVVFEPSPPAAKRTRAKSKRAEKREKR